MKLINRQTGNNCYEILKEYKGGLNARFYQTVAFFVGGNLKQDWDIVSIASNANIGGATSAPVCAASLGRPDLQLPGLLAGTVGNAIGTYLGILVAELLK